MNLPFICKFCDKRLYNSDYDNHICPRVANFIFHCKDCRACFHYSGQTKKTYYWYFAAGGYVAVFDLINQVFEIWLDEKYSEPLDRLVRPADKLIKPIIKLNQVPNTITPSNAPEKLKTYILFS